MDPEFWEDSWESDEVEENMVAVGSHTMMVNDLVRRRVRGYAFSPQNCPGKRASTSLVLLVADQHEYCSSTKIAGQSIRRVKPVETPIGLGVGAGTHCISESYYQGI